MIYQVPVVPSGIKNKRSVNHCSQSPNEGPENTYRAKNTNNGLTPEA